MEEIPTKYQLNGEPINFLELWKWFTDDAAKIKDRMWTIATFFIPCWVLWENYVLETTREISYVKNN